jgi:radical SAM superfamily enzyme YgiQ (UPF0313 family)
MRPSLLLEGFVMIMKKALKRILFLQLPRLENSDFGETENISLAGFYLSHSLKHAETGCDYAFRFLQPDEENLDDSHIIEVIAAWKPDIICATIYLWSVERSLFILKILKDRLPEIIIICGGPEVAPDHPFLYKEPIADAVVMGEGEGILPEVLNGFRGVERPDFRQVAWKTDKGYRFGEQEAPVPDLNESLPLPEDAGWGPDRQGMAYMETGRGCPMRCSYCRYPQMRRKPAFLNAADVLNRIRILSQRGANQIRFIDPTLNANPGFRHMLEGLKVINRDRHIRFFAELHADILEENDIYDLAGAGFTDIEVGVQSRDKDVLRLIHRPTGIEKLESNVRLMSEAGIRVTLDLMYGLPEQRIEDVASSFKWARRFKRTHIQCMQTLLLPGTELRETKDRWKIRANERPPYEVRSTSTLSPEDICLIEELLNKKQAGESMTSRFAGYRLPDLFEERIEISLESFMRDGIINGRTSKRALVFQKKDLYLNRSVILNVVSQAITIEPNMLWQFVIRPEEEEPLDLLKDMIKEIRKFPTHWLDHFAHASCWERLAGRRVFVHLKRNCSYSHEWIQACETLLEDHFY